MEFKVREVNGENFWVLQNTWDRMPIIEMSTSYLASSGALLYFPDVDIYHPRTSPRSPIYCCPSPVAESSWFEREDRESWEIRLGLISDVREGDCGQN